MSNQLEGKTVAILATDGVEQIELTRPREELESAGAKVELISIKSGSIDGYNHLDRADSFDVDKTVRQAAVEDYDGLVLPGGVANPDAMRLDRDAVALVARFVEEGKPVAAICHAPWLLVEADVVRGKTLTSFPSLQTDINNAGGHWVDRELCHEGGLITSRKPDDLDAFCSRLVEALAAES
ncbi:type 1 glutamine amidotransferase domain-containing protein [Marinobacter orientalis]|uniref:Type 1 glutamine amidotransferase n=1 Tax=Marinobacter orientalis TaxID=1928859 RepID=A0A7Y0RF94_9GAMM|nr:type 1 glutamine amidotransferase domain-containing protein [Marinobacter orientalis]NMT65133.1 type 1 glutamine amidotransferase [Marinobacter orientalis]TGX48922.1 type 1 glutamine amidotransferase [Marinobacter orientalis]